MARVLFVTLFDPFSMGVRLMAQALHHAGHEASVVYFKVAAEYEKEAPHPDPIGYETIGGGHLLSGFVRDEQPWTCREEELLLERIATEAPDLIGLSTRSPLDRVAVPLLGRVRRRFPEPVLVGGGFGPMLAPERYLEAVDFVVFGEGERAIVEMADALEAGRPLENIANLVSRNGKGEFVRNPVLPPERDVDRIPPSTEPATSWICHIEADGLHESDPATRTPDHPILAARGCVGTCTYCSAGHWSRLYRSRGSRVPPLRPRSTDRVLDELRAIRARGFRRIYFLDSFLVGPRRTLLELFDRYRSEIGLPFSANLHPNQMVRHPEILDAACRAGLDRAVLGVQHGCEPFRRRYLGRNLSNATLLQAARMYHDRGIRTEVHVIAGIPFETGDSLEASLDFVAQLPMEIGEIIAFRLNVFPHSELEALLAQETLPRAVDPRAWYLTGLLYYLRTLLPDASFHRVRETVTGICLEGNASGHGQRALVPRVADAIAGALVREGATAFGPRRVLEETYRRHLSRVGKAPVLVWGAGSAFARMRDLFEGATIEALVDNDPAKQGTIQDGIPIRAPSYLAGRNLPVFVCSHYKKEIVRQIRRDHPHVARIP